jgi:hypothetical protein
VAESLGSKYYFEPAIGHKFFRLRLTMILLPVHLKILNQPLNPQQETKLVSN